MYDVISFNLAWICNCIIQMFMTLLPHHKLSDYMTETEKKKQHYHQNKCQHWTFLQKTASFSILCCDSTERMVCLDHLVRFRRISCFGIKNTCFVHHEHNMRCLVVWYNKKHFVITNTTGYYPEVLLKIYSGSHTPTNTIW